MLVGGLDDGYLNGYGRKEKQAKVLGTIGLVVVRQSRLLPKHITRTLKNLGCFLKRFLNYRRRIISQ